MPNFNAPYTTINNEPEQNNPPAMRNGASYPKSKILQQEIEQARAAVDERNENIDRYRITVPDEVYKQFNQIIAYSDNPEDMAYKIGTSQKYAEMLDIPLTEAYENLDTLNREYWGEGKNSKSVFKSVVDMLTIGKNNVKQGKLGQELIDAEAHGNTELANALYKQLDLLDEENALYADNGTPRKWITKAFQAGAQSLPYTASNAGAAMFGAFIGGGVGAVAAGFCASTYLTAGQEYVEMRKKGIRPEIARNISFVDGAIQGGIEACLDTGLGIIFKGAGKGINNLSQDAIEKISNAISKKLHFGTGKKLATKWATNYFFNLGSEGGEETFQQTTSDVSQNIAISKENKKRREELEQALSAMQGEYSEALEEEIRAQYPQIDPMTLKEIVKDSAAQFIGGAMGAITLGLFNVGVSSVVTGASVTATEKANGATFGEAVKAGAMAGLKTPFANIDEYLQIKDLSESVKSEKMFKNRVENSAIFEGMNPEQKAQVIKQIFDEGQARATEAENKIADDIRESRDIGDNAEASPTDETGERTGKATEYRTEAGELYTEEDAHRKTDNDDDGKAHGRLLLGDPTRRHALEDDGNRYGYIDYSVDGDNVEIENFKMTAGREGLSKEFYAQFAEKFSDKNIVWNPKHETNINLKNEIIANNPNGKAAGLNYFTADTIDDNKARIKIADTIRKNTTNWSDEQVSAGTALLSAMAKAKGENLNDFVNKFFHNGQVITNKESDVANIAQAAAQHGAKMNDVLGAHQLDRAGRAIIYIGKNGDFNTFSHEVGHFARQSILSNEELAQAEQEFGVDQNTHKWTEAQEEAFADGFVNYLRTGKAKTKGLEKLFSKIAEFLHDVLRGLQGQIEINDNLRKVYDSLLKDDGSGLSRARKAVESAKAKEIAEKKAAKEQAKAQEKKEAERKEAARTTADRANEKADRVIKDENATTAERAEATIDSAIENARAVMNKQEINASAISRHFSENAGKITENTERELTAEEKAELDKALSDAGFLFQTEAQKAGHGHAKRLRDNFKTATNALVGTQLTNDATGNNANFSRKSQKELTSQLTNSKKNGFSVAEHFEAINKIEELYKSATLETPHADFKHGEKAVQIERYLSKEFTLSTGKNVKACITVKNSLDKNTRNIYALELMDTKKALEQTRAKAQPKNIGQHNDVNIQQKNADVNNGNAPLFQLVGEKGFSRLVDHLDHVAATSHDIGERTRINQLKTALRNIGVIKENGKINTNAEVAENGRFNVNLWSFSKQGEALIKATTADKDGKVILSTLNKEAKEKIFALGGIKRDANGRFIYKIPLSKLLLDSDGKEGSAGKYLFTAYPELKDVSVQFASHKDATKEGENGILSNYDKKTNTIFIRKYGDSNFIPAVVKGEISKQIDGFIQNIEADASEQARIDEYFNKMSIAVKSLLADRPDIDAKAAREALQDNKIYKETVKAISNKYAAPVLFQTVTEEDLKKRIDSVKHTPQRADYIKRYYSDIKEQYHEEEISTSSGKAKIEIANEKDITEKSVKKELDALVQFANLGFYPTLLSESMKIGEERHIDALLNHDVLLEIKHPTGNVNGIAKEIQNGINKGNSEIISVFLIDNADISDEAIQERLNKKLPYLHGTTDGIFIFRNGKLSEIKTPRVESFQTRSLGNSNSTTESGNVNSPLFQFEKEAETELFNEAKKFDKWEDFRDSIQREELTPYVFGAEDKAEIDIDDFISQSEISRAYKQQEIERINGELQAIAQAEAGAYAYDIDNPESFDALPNEAYRRVLLEEKQVLESALKAENDVFEKWTTNEEATNEFYKSLFKRAKQSQRLENISNGVYAPKPENDLMSDDFDKELQKIVDDNDGDTGEAVETIKDKEFYDFISTDEYALSQFLQEVAFIAEKDHSTEDEVNKPSDEGELRILEERERLATRYAKEMKHSSFRYAVLQALKDLNPAHKVELTDRQRKTIMTLIRNNKRDYRDLYADFMNDSDWSVAEGYSSSDKLAVRLMSPDFTVDDYTPEERARLAEKLDFDDLKRELKDGSMKMELFTVQKLANGYEDELKAIKDERKKLQKKIEDTAEASKDETRRLNYLHKQELEKIEKKEQAREVQKLKVKLLKNITRKVRFDNVYYEQGQKIELVQSLFLPQLKKYVNAFLNSQEPYLREAYSQYKTDFDYRAKLQALANRTGATSGTRKLVKLFDSNKPFEQWTDEERELVARYLPRTDWIKELKLDELYKNKNLNLSLQTEEVQSKLKEILPSDILSNLTNKALRDWTLEDVEELAKIIDDLRRDGREKLREKREIEIERANHLRDKIEKELLSHGLHIDDNDPPEEKERKQKAIDKFKRDKLPKILGIGNATKGTYKASLEKKSAFNRLLHGYGDMNMKRFARMLDNGENGINTTLFVDMENDCFNAEHRAIKARSENVERVMNELKITQEDLAKMVTVDFGGEKQEYSIDELLFFREAAQDDQSRAAVMYGNMYDETVKAQYRDTPFKQAQYEAMARLKFAKVLKAAEKAIEEQPALAEFAKAIAQDYDEQYERMDAICKSVFMKPIGRVKKYVPLVRLESNGDTNENKVKADMLGITGSLDVQKVDDGNTKQRQYISPVNQKPVEIGLLKTWNSSVNRTEHFIAYSGYVKELKRVFDSRDSAKMKMYLENRYGQEAMQYIRDYINEVANPDVSSTLSELDKVVRTLRGRTAPAYLAWKLSGIIKQACTSPYPFMAYATPAEYFSACLDFAKNKEVREAIKDKSAYMDSRVFDPMIDLLNEQQAKDTNPLAYKYDSFMKKGMEGLEIIDWVCVAPGWLAVYRKELKNGASEEKAVAKADEVVRMCQPSSRLADLSPMFKERGKGSEIARAFLQFTTSLNVIWQNIRYDLPNALKHKQFAQAIGTIAGYVLAGITVGLVTEGLSGNDGDGDDEETRRINHIRKFLQLGTTQFTDSVPVFGSLATSTVSGLITGKWQFQKSGGDLFPVVDKGMSGIKAISREEWDKAAKYFGEALAIELGLPISGTKELLYSVGIGDGNGKLEPRPDAFFGRRDKD